MDMWDMQGHMKANTGFLKMNREHRYNTLTPSFAKTVKRGVESMFLDHSVALIYLSTVEGEHFCNGTDFRTILYHLN